MPTLQVLICVFLKQFMVPSLREYFPSTLFCLNPIIINEIKTSGGKTFVYNVPFEWLDSYVAILVYCNNCDKSSY
ncbi:MAG: hypothetical protein ACXWE0_01195 [Nitrososphaeraceae archaeon]